MREAEIIRCIVDEQKDRVIAAQLGISTHTVRSDLERMFRKLGVQTRTGVVVAVFTEAMRIVGEEREIEGQKSEKMNEHTNKAKSES